MVRSFSPIRVVPFALVATLAMLCCVCAALAYPKPAAVPYRWELTFDPGEFRLYIDEATGDSFWYFTYTVTNRTDKDQLWAPKLTLMTDEGEIMDAGKNVPTRVTEELLHLLNNPLLEDQNDVIGDIFRGRENAKEGLAIWPAQQVHVNQMSMFIAGISGETARVKNPVTSEEVILRKTLHREYLIPGDATARGSKPIELTSEGWIMR